jgi:Fe-S-cluster-containing dehydrogenase component
MTRYAMAVDLARCVGCDACMVACKAENGVPEGVFRLRVGEVTWGEPEALKVEALHAQCYHCEGAPCVSVCPTGATYVDRATGIVKIDPAKCTGCKACVVACPYGMRHVDPAGGFADKCSFCDHRLARGQLPACVDVCPTAARIFGDLDRADSPIGVALKQARRTEVDRPELGTRPKFFFLNGQRALGPAGAGTAASSAPRGVSAAAQEVARWMAWWRATCRTTRSPLRTWKRGSGTSPSTSSWAGWSPG